MKFAQILLAAVLVACGWMTIRAGNRNAARQQPANSTTPTAQTAPAAQDDSRVPAADLHFAVAAAQGGMAEVKLGELAQLKSSSQKVRDFAKRMVDDHSRAGDQLKGDAAMESITLPADLSSKDQALYDQLSQMTSGRDFDRAYAQAMVKDHEQDVNAFQKEANNGKDARLKNFARQTGPALQEHLRMARTMLREVSQARTASASL